LCKTWACVRYKFSLQKETDFVMASRAVGEFRAPDAVRVQLSSVAQPTSGALRLVSEMPAACPSLFSSGVAWVTLDFISAASIMISALWQHGRRAGIHELYGNPSYWIAGLAFACLVLLLSWISGVYTTDANRAGFRLLLRLLQCAVLATLGFYGFESATGLQVASLGFLIVVVGLTVAAMLASRMGWQRHRSNASRRETIGRSFLIVGQDEIGRGVRDYLCSLPFAPYACKGFICMPGESMQTGDVVGDIRQTMQIARSMFVDEVIFSRRPEIPGLLKDLIHQAHSMGIDVRIIPSLTETLANRADVQYIGDLPTIAVLQRRHDTLSRLLKRTIDIMGASLALVMMAPVFIAIAIAIKVQSPGPVLYLSKRVGYKGRVFTCFKFRTMVVDAASMQAALAHLNERSGVLFKMSKDPRVTRIGALLRKYSLDELPQLWNVLRGNMSLVGPRPSISSEVAQYEPAHLRRLDVVPGITGLWQVEARQDPSFESYIKFDSEYVKHWSLWLDLKILLRTINAVFTGTGS
jgi:exopolysaccharide biosynthesis polyprenyl glycosylphosphotransferase